MRLERAPARKSVLFRELELRVGELRGTVGLAQRFEAMLRLFTEPLEAWFFRKRQRIGGSPGWLSGHQTPSFLRKSANPFIRPASADGRGTEGLCNNGQGAG